MIAGLEFVLIHVPDVAAARAFYAEKLGFQIEAERPDFLQFTQQLGGAVFAIGQGDSPRTSDGGIELWWSVSEADATYRELIAKGVESLDAPHDMPFGRAFSVKVPPAIASACSRLPAARYSCRHSADDANLAFPGRVERVPAMERAFGAAGTCQERSTQRVTGLQGASNARSRSSFSRTPI